MHANTHAIVKEHVKLIKKRNIEPSTRKKTSIVTGKNDLRKISEPSWRCYQKLDRLHTRADVARWTLVPETCSPNSLENHANNLETPFAHDEIENIVKALPNYKSPGPDGFNNEFTKDTWPVIKHEFYNLCNSFFENSCCLRSINGSYITLIPKVETPTVVNDFKPISLLNTSIKLLTKILATRLQQRITQLIHKNQYGFIKTRTIQDCLAWTFEYILLGIIKRHTQIRTTKIAKDELSHP